MWSNVKVFAFGILLMTLVSLACDSASQIQAPTPVRTVWKTIIYIYVTSTPEPSSIRTPTSSPRPTITVQHTQTPKVFPTQAVINQQSGYVSLLGRIYSGVKVYYGANKAYGFEILGGSDDCPSAPSGRGVVVEYPDGTKEWKDRLYLVSSGLYFIKANDPAVDEMEWYEYSNCP